MDTQATETAPVTVNQILERYQKDCLQALAPRTRADYKRHLGHLKRAFGTRVAAELKPKDFAGFLNVPKGVTHRVRMLGVLSAAFTQAVSYWYVLDHNILKDVKRPKRPPRDRLILDEEFHACKALAPRRIGLAMDLALLTAQRQGEEAQRLLGHSSPAMTRRVYRRRIERVQPLNFSVVRSSQQVTH